MPALIVSATGHVVPQPATLITGPTGPFAVGRDTTALSLYLSVTQADGTPATGLSGGNFTVTLFTGRTPEFVSAPTTVPEQDENGNPVLDDDGNPQVSSLVRPLTQSGVYFLGSVVVGLAAQAFFVQVQSGGDQGQAVGTALPFVRGQ